MKLRFKHQKFQEDAAMAVVDVFKGQPFLTRSFLVDRGIHEQMEIKEELEGWNNAKIVPSLSHEQILENIQQVQRRNGLKPSEKLEGRYNLTVEMETGVGKTYTYIKTIYELNKHYGWCKFIVIVPSVAIREGVRKSFEVTQEHFVGEYGKKIRFFIYNSQHLTEIENFASDSNIHVMIINSQAFNAQGKDARRILTEQESFRWRKPIDVLAATRPILIIDEPQSVEGKKTQENMKKFKPLLTLRYSATPREEYNLVYRLDAMDAYNKQLVKKITVKGISTIGTTATESYVYLESINLSKDAPTATLQFDVKSEKGVKVKSRVVERGTNLYVQSNELEEYRNGFIVTEIDGRDNSVTFQNGVKLFEGGVIGKVDEEQLRRIQIRETILSHLERERKLFRKGIKVLSLFFIDEVARYRQYDESGNPRNGQYAQMFEEEYADVFHNFQLQIDDDPAYLRYLEQIPVTKTHAGYFSIDKKGKMVETKETDKKEHTSDDISAYDLIMKDKERLLDRDPVRSPVRFIFSHSALREGWDNPNVFQICTLKQSASSIKKRQEVGRGLRLCVNQNGERMDDNVLGKEVQELNVLTVIASESYEEFARGLQTELAEIVKDRPRKITVAYFVGKKVLSQTGETVTISEEMATSIYHELVKKDYIDTKGTLTEKYYADKKQGAVQFSEELEPLKEGILQQLDQVYNTNLVEDARGKNVELHLDRDKMAMPEFKALWDKINVRSFYTVSFDGEELVKNAVKALNERLKINQAIFQVESGSMEKIASKAQLEDGKAFTKNRTQIKSEVQTASTNTPFDLVGKLVEKTDLTRRDVIRILKEIKEDVFCQFQNNPEEFILKCAEIINDEKAAAVIEHITYNRLNERYSTEIFTEQTARGQLDINAMRTQKHLYDHLVSDSEVERKFASELETHEEVVVYVKLPRGFFISTPVGKYNPDWAIAFREGDVKHVYFVAETKGSLATMELREIEKAKIHCAKEHFRAISNENVIYEVVNSYEKLLSIVQK